MRARGFTLLELVIVVAIVGIMASVAMPLARWSAKRTREYELQQNLRLLRNALDRYRDAAAAGIIEVAEGDSGFPPSLDVLVEGVPIIAPVPGPVPAVGGEYDATGPGLGGGLQALAQQQASGGGAGGAGGAGAPAAGSMFEDDEDEEASPGQQVGGNRAMSGLRGLSSAFRTLGQSGALGQGGQQGAQGAFGQLQGAAAADALPEPILGPDGQPLKLMFLRRLPVDPFTGTADWGLRCYGEVPDDRMWCGKDVFDVYSKSPARAIDGTFYRDW